MPVSYRSPGVYIEEVDRGTKPIEALGTSVTAFVGITAEASRKAFDPATGERIVVESVVNKPIMVTNWTQFTDTFGDFISGAYLPDAVYGYFSNGGGVCYVTSLRALNEEEGLLSAASAAIPSNSKAASFTATARQVGPVGNALKISIKVAADETFTISVGGETKSGISMKKGEAYIGGAEFETITISKIGAEVPVNGTYALTGGGIRPLAVADFIGDVTERTGLGGLEALDEIRLVCVPDLMSGYDGSKSAKERVKSVQQAVIDHCQKLRYRFAILDTPPGLNPQQAKEWRELVNFDTSYAAMYYPWIKVVDLSGTNNAGKLAPPSGYVAGIYNRTDNSRGVHKAPANDVVLGALDLEINVSKGEQDVLNPIGVNCIRAFPGRGIRVWGARTLSSDGAWRYINVRRLFIMVEASMEAGLSWVVFEPNDSSLWAKVSRDVTSFLRVVWRSGALFGTTADQAFYVKCDEELNPPEIRDLGQLIIEVGLAPVKPAEFVIFRISQWAGSNAEA
ncbi:MAG: phage tail sheath subtilisin-like domain-containing protein [Anaerolineaceae bacterium]|nr:phage tail sheath subtilisin-like domain-containing protein [Anaerolineaceae bacterium]